MIKARCSAGRAQALAGKSLRKGSRLAALTCADAAGGDVGIRLDRGYLRFVQRCSWQAGSGYQPIEEGAGYVRKYLYLAVAAASAAVLAAPIIADAAPAAHSRVLTIRKVGGTAVKGGATLKASLAKGASAVFSIGPITISCKQSSFTAKVIRNPTKPGKATESITAESIGKCVVSGFPMAKVTKDKVLNLPYNSSVSDKRKFPVAISGRNRSKPIELFATVSLGTSSLSCTYKATTIAGTASNRTNTITIVKQKFVLASGAGCPSNPAFFTAKYGPVKDTSVRGNPKVFVN